MEVTEPFVFQADANIVQNQYNEHANYLIEYNENVPSEYCIVYFSSNDLYYPNTEAAFFESVVKKNRFEWYGNRINYGHKHIFFRDIKKQWYLNGVNKIINSPQKIAEFIKYESEGYKLILVGSSAGGFISVILGQMLNAERIYTFNGQFEILSLLKKSTVQIVNPILYRSINNKALFPFYDSIKFIHNPKSIFYFQSSKSSWDIIQNNHIGNIPINKICFKTSNHGLPFLKSNASAVLNLSFEDLQSNLGNTVHPLIFSFKMVGFFKTIQGLYSIAQFALNKIYINSFQKWKLS